MHNITRHKWGIVKCSKATESTRLQQFNVTRCLLCTRMYSALARPVMTACLYESKMQLNDPTQLAAVSLLENRVGISESRNAQP